MATVIPTQPGWVVISADETEVFTGSPDPVVGWQITDDGAALPITPLGLVDDKKPVFLGTPGGKYYDIEFNEGPFDTAEEAFDHNRKTHHEIAAIVREKEP